LHGDNHKVFAAMIALMHEQSLQLEVDEYNTSDCLLSGFFGLARFFPNGGSGSVSV